MVQAFYLSEAGYKVHLVEKEQRLGGLLESVQTTDFLFETAANAMIANRELERVAQSIGVELIQPQKLAKKRYIYKQGQFKRWPVGWQASFSMLGFLIKKKWRHPKYKPSEGESLYEWASQHLGIEATDYLLTPALQGVFATHAQNLDAELVLDSISKKTAKGRLKGSVAPRGGMQEWVDKMEAYLRGRGVSISLGSEDFDVLSTPTVLALDLSSLKKGAVQKKWELDPSLLETRLASLTSVSLGFSQDDQKIREGFGCLFPRSEKMHALGVLFNHSLFEGRANGGASETWILNDENIEFSSLSQSALLRYIHSDRSHLLKNGIPPQEVMVSQWPQRIPIYDKKLATFLKKQKQAQPPFLLVGNYLGDLGLAKILFHAQENVEKIKGGYFA